MGTVDAGAIPPSPSGSERRQTVLVVDDAADMRELLREVLSGERCQVLTAATGEAALRMMARQRPDLVITDLFMPGMSGFSLRSTMLRRPELADVPVIVLSAYWKRPGETLEAVAVLPKPLKLDSLLRAVREAIGSPAPG
jgi:CheY-like chemotaxis protein